MAHISRRFENPNGRSVVRVAARVYGHSTYFAAPSNAPVNLGVGFMLRLEDDRTIDVRLTHAELDELVAFRNEMDAKYPRG